MLDLFFSNLVIQFWTFVFSLDKLEKLEKNDWEKLPVVLPTETILIPSAEMVAEASKEDPIEEAKENDEEEEESGNHPPCYVQKKTKSFAIQVCMHLDLSVLLKEPS